MLFTVLLTLGLNMSLPEFQPSQDISGDYIVGTFDVSSDEFIVETLEDVSTNSAPSVTEIISSVPVRSEQLSLSGNDDVVVAIESLQNDNNAYWELFLDSYAIQVEHFQPSISFSPSWYCNASFGISNNNGNYKMCYVPVSSGVTYHINSISKPAYGYFRYYVCDNLTSPTVITNGGTNEPYSDNFYIVPSQDGYFIMQIWYDVPFGSFTALWTTEERESYTLSELGNAVMTINSKVELLSVIAYILAFMAFVPFLTKTVDKLMNKKED